MKKREKANKSPNGKFLKVTQNVNYDSFSIALMIAFDALNQLHKLVYDVFEYVQYFDLEV